MEQNPNPFSDPNFFRITAFSTALGFGCLLAFLFSLRDIRHDVSFDFSTMTIVWFLVGAFTGYGFWAWIRRRTARLNK